MLNCKVKCVKAGANSFTENKIYEVINGTLRDNYGIPYEEITGLNELNISLTSKFELYEEPQSSPIQDSGTRREFETGAVRDMQEGKGDMMSMPPNAILRLSKHYEIGAEKYERFNYLKGIPCTSFMDSALRHLMKYNAGWDDEDHLSAAVFNILGIMEMEKIKPEMQDIPNRENKKEYIYK